MADFGSPIVDPNAPPAGQRYAQFLNSILESRQKQQALQIGQQQLQQQTAETQQAQQKNMELQALSNFTKSAINNPDYQDSTGRLDANKFKADAATVAPVYGADYINKYIDGANAIIAGKRAATSLTKDQNDLASGYLKGAATSNDPNDFNTAVRKIREIDPKNSALQDMANTLQERATINGYKQAAANGASMLGGFSQQAPSTLNTGGAIQPGATNQFTGAFTPAQAPIQMGVSPGERTNVGINPLTGQPYTVNKPASGVGATVGAPPIQQGPQGGLGPFPTPQQAASASAASQEADAVRAGDSNPVSGYAPTKQVYSNLLDLVQTNPAIGPNSKGWNKLTSVLTPFGASANSSMQEIDSYLDRLALQNAGAAGLSTDAARSMSATAAGSTEMNPEALKEKLRFGAATLEASHAYRQGLDKVVGLQNQNPIAKRAFDAAWSQNADINAFRLLAAKNTGDKEGYQKALENIKKLPPQQRAIVQQKMMNLNALTNGQMPQ